MIAKNREGAQQPGPLLTTLKSASDSDHNEEPKIAYIQFGKCIRSIPNVLWKIWKP